MYLRVVNILAVFTAALGFSRINPRKVNTELLSRPFQEESTNSKIFGDFKFIHFFLLPLIFISLKNFKKNNKNLNILNFAIVFATIAFFFNQLIKSINTIN